MRILHNSKGFNLVELLVVIVIMAIIATIGTPWLLSMRTKSSIRADARDVHSAFRLAQTRAIKSYEDVCLHVVDGAGEYGIYVLDYFPTTYSAKKLRPGNSFVLAAKGDADYFALEPCFNPRGLPSENGALDIRNSRNVLTMEVRLRPAGHVSSTAIGGSAL